MSFWEFRFGWKDSVVICGKQTALFVNIFASIEYCDGHFLLFLHARIENEEKKAVFRTSRESATYRASPFGMELKTSHFIGRNRLKQHDFTPESLWFPGRNGVPFRETWQWMLGNSTCLVGKHGSGSGAFRWGWFQFSVKFFPWHEQRKAA